MNLRITNFRGDEIEVKPYVALYTHKDFMGKPIPDLAIILDALDKDGNVDCQYAVLTKSFGEHISIKNCAYVDTNNCSFAEELLEQGIARKTGFTMKSGHCTYPLWKFDEAFLKECGGTEYEKYSQAHDDYTRALSHGEDENED